MHVFTHVIYIYMSIYYMYIINYNMFDYIIEITLGWFVHMARKHHPEAIPTPPFCSHEVLDRATRSSAGGRRLGTKWMGPSWDQRFPHGRSCCVDLFFLEDDRLGWFFVIFCCWLWSLWTMVKKTQHLKFRMCVLLSTGKLLLQDSLSKTKQGFPNVRCEANGLHMCMATRGPVTADDALTWDRDGELYAYPDANHPWSLLLCMRETRF